MDDRAEAYRRLIADVYELAGVSRRTSEAIAAEIGHTAARWHVMSAASDTARTVPAIARRLGLRRQSVQPVVDRLHEDGLVTLEPNPDHARSPLVRLTGRGRRDLDELFRRSTTSRVAVLERAGLGVDDLVGARAVVRALVAGFDDVLGDVRT